jgi:hypothetical protein
MSVGNNLHAILPIGNMNLSSSVIERSMSSYRTLPTTQNRNMSSIASSSTPQSVQLANAVGGQFRRFNRKQLHCTHYSFSGHTVDRCYKKHGYPVGYKGKKTPSTQQGSAINYAEVGTAQSIS